MAQGKQARRRANGEGGIFLRAGSKFYWCQYYTSEGRQIRLSTGSHVKSEAIAFLRRQMDSKDKAQTPLTDVKKLRYADLRQGLIDSYVAQGNKSLKSKADGQETIAGLTSLDKFCGFIRDGAQVINPGVPVTQITTDFAARFTKERLAEDEEVGNAAINRSLAALRRMLVLAKRAKKIHDVPYFQFLKEPSARKGFLGDEKFRELLSLLPTHLRPLVILLYQTGVRVGEALQVEWSQVNLDTRLIRLEEEQTKNSEPRILPLTSELAMMLAAVEPTQCTGKVFDGTNLRKQWITACAACGLGILTPVEGRPYDPIYSGLTLHDLRRSAIRNMIQRGVSEQVAMRISGHKTVSVFRRYNIVATDDITRAMQMVETASLGNGSRLLNGDSGK